MHLTTRVEGDPHQGLLREKGGSGFPYLVFMDAEGEVLAKQGDRSVDAIFASARALKDLPALTERVADGDPRAKIELFLAELALGRLTFEQATARHAELVNVTKEQEAKILPQLATLEYQELITAMRDASQRASSQARVLAMFNEGRVPGGVYALSFLSQVMAAAEQARDADTFAKALARFEELTKDRKGIDRAIEQMRQRLQKLRDGG